MIEVADIAAHLGFIPENPNGCEYKGVVEDDAISYIFTRYLYDKIEGGWFEQYQ